MTRQEVQRTTHSEALKYLFTSDQALEDIVPSEPKPLEYLIQGENSHHVLWRRSILEPTGDIPGKIRGLFLNINTDCYAIWTNKGATLPLMLGAAKKHLPIQPTNPRYF